MRLLPFLYAFSIRGLTTKGGSVCVIKSVLTKVFYAIRKCVVFHIDEMKNGP
jgi:hypothetical protein